MMMMMAAMRTNGLDTRQFCFRDKKRREFPFPGCTWIGMIFIYNDLIMLFIYLYKYLCETSAGCCCCLLLLVDPGI